MDSIPNYDPGLLIPGRQADFTVPGTPGAPETEDIVGTDRHRSAIPGTAQGDQQPVPPAGIEPPPPRSIMCSGTAAGNNIRGTAATQKNSAAIIVVSLIYSCQALTAAITASRSMRVSAGPIGREITSA